MPDEEFSWKESYQFKEKDLPDGKYAFTYEVTDITGKSTMSDVAFLNLKNGERAENRLSDPVSGNRNLPAVRSCTVSEKKFIKNAETLPFLHFFYRFDRKRRIYQQSMIFWEHGIF